LWSSWKLNVIDWMATLSPKARTKAMKKERRMFFSRVVNVFAMDPPIVAS
jgi:hypothetical protein